MTALNINKNLQSYDVLTKYWMNVLKDGNYYLILYIQIIVYC